MPASRTMNTCVLRLMLIIVNLGLLCSANTIPTVAYPFNAQVPLVACIDQEYEFQFSKTTFAPSTADYAYTLCDGPSWLSIDSTSGTLTGLPARNDSGYHPFTLVAQDFAGTVQTQCVLAVVACTSSLKPNGSFTDHLTTSSNVSSSNSEIVTLLPMVPFWIEFDRYTFGDLDNGSTANVSHYSVLADRTPLPSWLVFDPVRLRFTGTAPQLGYSSVWNILLIVSNVPGFAVASFEFTIIVGVGEFAFAPAKQRVHVTPGTVFHYTNLRNSLYANGTQLSADDLSFASLAAPDWVEFEPSTLDLGGNVPTAFTSESCTVRAVDKFGAETAVDVILIANLAADSSDITNGDSNNGSSISTDSSNSSGIALFTDLAPLILVAPGEDIMLDIASTFLASATVQYDYALTPNATWLSLDIASGCLRGTVPCDTGCSNVIMNITAQQSGSRVTQTHMFEISIIAPGCPYSNGTISNSTDATCVNATSGTNGTHMPPLPSVPNETRKDDKYLAPGVIAAIILSAFGLAVVLILYLFAYCHKSGSVLRRNFGLRPLSVLEADGNERHRLSTHAEPMGCIADEQPKLPVLQLPVGFDASLPKNVVNSSRAPNRATPSTRGTDEDVYPQPQLRYNVPHQHGDTGYAENPVAARTLNLFDRGRKSGTLSRTSSPSTNVSRASSMRSTSRTVSQGPSSQYSDSSMWHHQQSPSEGQYSGPSLSRFSSNSSMADSVRRSKLLKTASLIWPKMQSRQSLTFRDEATKKHVRVKSLPSIVLGTSMQSARKKEAT